MCGIAGLTNLDGAPATSVVVSAMCELIAHRGPDDHGLWSSGQTVLGHRRLSIIDLSPRGRNPMTNEDQSVWLVYNGELYNYKELRPDLVQKGHRFRSETDTEVIIHLYEEVGPQFVERLNGMFALAVWDVNRRRLVLARDRFGVKPLYYTLVGNTLAFASEIKAFLALPGFSVQADPYALAEHFTFQNTFGDRTLFKGVNLLPAGHYLVAENGSIETTQYWDLRFNVDEKIGLDDWAEQLRSDFEKAVRRQLMSDVPLGSFLSGGMDTGAISAVATRAIPNIHTFTCGFKLPENASDLEKYFDERQESHELARVLATTHHELELGPESMIPVLPRVVWHLDEPRVGISYQVYYTAEMIRRYVTVVLSGVGGDELFAGYPWRYAAIDGIETEDFEESYYRQWIRFLTDDEKRQFFSPSLKQALGDFNTRDSFRIALGGASRGDDALHSALYFDFKTFLNGLLIVEDKLSMAHSVESRVPFLDNDLIDTVSRIPSSFKFDGKKTKIVLKQAMKGLLPDEVLERRKQGFTPPDQSWYKGQTLDYIRGLILGPRALERAYFEPAYLEKILDDHLNDRRNNRFLIWSLMCFEWWNRLFIDREPVD